MTKLNVVELPTANVNDVPGAIRRLADDIDSGRYGDAHAISWVIDCGDGRVQIGGAGESASPAGDAHLLFAIAQRKLEHGGAEI